MTEDQRTFEAEAGLLQGLRLVARPVRDKGQPEECLHEGKLDAKAVGVSASIPPELILRLIRRLKES